MADSLNRDRDTINNSVNRETIRDKLTAIRNGEPTNESYEKNGYARKLSGGTDGNDTNQRLGSSFSRIRKKKGHSMDDRGVSEYIGSWEIRILECGRRGASYVHVS